MATTIINNYRVPSDPFEIVVDTRISGGSPSNQITLASFAGGVHNYLIDWGDGTALEEKRDGLPITHIYEIPGVYTIKMIGVVRAINFLGTLDRTKLLSVNKWGGCREGFIYAFFGCVNLTSLPTSKARMVISNMQQSFDTCSKLLSIPFLNTSSVISFRQAWRNCLSLTSFPLLDTSSGTNFSQAWRNCLSLTSFPLIDTSSGTNFGYAWSGCSGLTSFPLLDTSSGTDFTDAWRSCSGLTSFPLLDISSGTNFAYAWYGCSSLTSFPLLDISSGTNFAYAWYGCSSLTSFPLLDISSSTSFYAAWQGCSSLTSFPANFFDTWVGVPVVDCFLNTWLSCNALTAQSVENILVSIDTSGQSAPAGATGTQADITITYNVATGALTGATNTAITNLKAKGWKPHINNVYV